MTITQQIITFAAAAQQFPAISGFGLCAKITAEPLRTNTHECYVGTAAVSNDASGVGVITQLAQPGAATVIMDRFSVEHQGSLNVLDPGQFYGHGTSGEKLLVTYYQA